MKAPNHALVQWTLPFWAAAVLFETVQRDSQSLAFDPDLRKTLAAALDTVTETNLYQMKSHMITMKPDGTVHCLWTEAIPLQELGSLEVHRAGTVEFNPTAQLWEVRLASKPDGIAFSHVSRRACLDWEREALQ